MPDQADLDIYQGDDYAATVSVLDAAGNPVDLAGYQARAHIRKGPGQAYPVIVDVAVSVNPNTITLAIPASQTSGLSGKYIWDLELTSTEGIVTTILHGYVNVSNEVTRVWNAPATDHSPAR